MRLPKITRGTYTKKDIQTVEIKAGEFPKCIYIPDFDIGDQKSVDKYVRVIKAFVRGSMEYKGLMSFLKYSYNLDCCHYLPNVKQHKGEKITIEQHHLAGTISDIIETVLRKRSAEGEDCNATSIAEEVMILHYQGKLSLVPLSSTIHELIHADGSELFIPVQDSEFGDTRLFYNDYKEYMTSEKKAQFDKYFLLSDAFTNIEELIPDCLNVSILYFNVEGVQIPRMDTLMELLDNVA